MSIPLSNSYNILKKKLSLIIDWYTYHKNKDLTIPVYEKKSASALVFGNGPSLKDFFEENQNGFPDTDIYVCNAFAKTKYYELFKPAFYCLLDPLYFDLEDHRVLNKTVDVLDVWGSIFKKTNWPIVVYTSLDSIDKKNNIIDRFGENKWITWINLAPVNFYSKNKYTYYAKNIGLIGGMTVVHLSLQMAILNKYAEIYLAGVDHDWVENIRYDSQNNKVYLLNKHFFDETKLYYGEGILEKINLELEFASLSRSFRGFRELLDFAEIKGVKVYLCSKSFLHFIPFRQFSLKN